VEADRMLRRIAIGLLCAIAAYVFGAFAGGLLVNLFSSNTHDRSTEAAMTGAFIFGPLAALAGFALGVWWAGKRGGP
jgi:Na+/proline symporter